MTFFSVIYRNLLVFLPPSISSSAHVCLIRQRCLPWPSDPRSSSAQDIYAFLDLYAFERDIFGTRFHGPRSWRGEHGALLGSSQPGIDQSLNVSDFRVDGVPKAADVMPVFPTDRLRWVLGAEESRRAVIEASLYQVEHARHANAKGGQRGLHDD